MADGGEASLSSALPPPADCLTLLQMAGILITQELHEGFRMTKIQDLYESRVKPMVPAERLQLARLILDDLAPSETTIDVSNHWDDDDLADLAAYSAQHAGQPTSGAGDEKR